MPVRINFQGVSTEGFAPFDENTPIEFTIFKIEQKIGKESHEPYWAMEFKQVGGNRRAWRNYSLQPQALFGLKKLLVALDKIEDDFEGDFDPEELKSDLLGATVHLVFGPVKKSTTGKDTQEVLDVQA